MNKITAFVLSLFAFSVFAQKLVRVEGVVKDASGYEVPYAAVSIPAKAIGTSTTEDGSFSIILPTDNLNDIIKISSIGFKTYKTSIDVYLKNKEKVIVLEDDVVSLDEVMLLAPGAYVKSAIKNLKNTTLSDRHQLKMLYRRFSTEAGKARFLVEHRINVLDQGLSKSQFSRIEVVEGRKSADYRFLKDKYPGHQAVNVANTNPLRKGLNRNGYNWTKIGNSSYDGEDIIIVEGKGKKNKWQWTKLYIGLQTSGVYKIESSNLDSVWVYKKRANGKLVLSYHNRAWEKELPVNNMQKKLLGIASDKVSVSYRHEAFILGVETNLKKIKVGNFDGYNIDMGDIPVKYNPDFWKSFSMPPETAFYKKTLENYAPFMACL